MALTSGIFTRCKMICIDPGPCVVVAETRTALSRSHESMQLQSELRSTKFRGCAAIDSNRHAFCVEAGSSRADHTGR